MAEKTEQSTNWWGSWIDSAKSKSASVFEAVKKDLDELSTAATNAGNVLAESLKIDEPDSTANVVKKSISSFFGQVTEALIPSIEEDDSEMILITSDGSVLLTGFQKHLAELQKNEETYSEEPSNELIGKYKRWMEVVEQDQFTEPRLSKYLASSQILNEKYLKLVPDKIPHMEFWKRYLFKKALLEDAIANAEMAERKAKLEMNSNAPSVTPNKTIIQTTQPKKVCNEDDKLEEENQDEISKEELKWIGDEINCNDVELSEEEQARLLAEYEEEIQGRDKRKPYGFLDDPVRSKQIPKNEKSTKYDNKINEKPTNAVKKNQKNISSAKSNNEKTATQQQNVNKNMNKTIKTIPTNDNKKNTKVLKQQTQQQLTAQQKPTAQQQQQQQSKEDVISQNITKSKSDEKDDNLKIEKNHFTKDDISSNSDESWEKEFDLDE